MCFKKVMPLVLASIAFSANAECSVTSSYTSDQVESVINNSNGWKFKNYNTICAKLAQANAKLFFSGQATVLSGKSIAWADVSIAAKELPLIVPEFGGSSTQVNDYASMDKAREVLFDALNSAVDSMNIDKAIEELNSARRKVKAGNR